jgi:hypothetical protein
MTFHDPGWQIMTAQLGRICCAIQYFIIYVRLLPIAGCVRKPTASSHKPNMTTWNFSNDILKLFGLLTHPADWQNLQVARALVVLIVLHFHWSVHVTRYMWWCQLCIALFFIIEAIFHLHSTAASVMASLPLNYDIPSIATMHTMVQECFGFIPCNWQVQSAQAQLKQRDVVTRSENINLQTVGACLLIFSASWGINKFSSCSVVADLAWKCNLFSFHVRSLILALSADLTIPYAHKDIDVWVLGYW